MARVRTAAAPVVLNPRGTQDFGRRHVILNGRTALPVQVSSFTGPFSIKTVMRGKAVWETAHGRYELTPGRHVVLNAGTRYSLSIDAREPVETFCVFFANSFLEDALRTITTSAATLLESPDGDAAALALLESIDDDSESLGAELERMRRLVRRGDVAAIETSGALHDAAVAMVTRSAAFAQISRRLPAIKGSTRREILRRLQRAREFMRGDLANPHALADIAREACLSPFHFHRSFRACFGETPHQFMLRLRLDTAAERLRRTVSPVAEIGMTLGFESPAHFSRAFKRRYLVPPQQYRTGVRSRIPIQSEPD